MPISDVRIVQAESAAQIEQARELFQEYAQSLGFSLCFQNFDQELAGLPGDYAAPAGRLLLVEYENQLAACGALHPFAENSNHKPSKLPEFCEMKRLYVRPQFRGKGLGKLLAEYLINAAREVGYQRMRLDTIEQQMTGAVALYRQLGFKEIAPYRPNPIAGVLYMELEL